MKTPTEYREPRDHRHSLGGFELEPPPSSWIEVPAVFVLGVALCLSPAWLTRWLVSRGLIRLMK